MKENERTKRNQNRKIKNGTKQLKTDQNREKTGSGKTIEEKRKTPARNRENSSERKSVPGRAQVAPPFDACGRQIGFAATIGLIDGYTLHCFLCFLLRFLCSHCFELVFSGF